MFLRRSQLVFRIYSKAPYMCHFNLILIYRNKLPLLREALSRQHFHMRGEIKASNKFNSEIKESSVLTFYLMFLYNPLH